MDYSIETLALDKLETDCIIVGLYDNQQLSPAAETINQLNQGLISKVIDRGDIKGKNAETLMINYLPNSSIQRVLLVGLGNKEKLTAKSYRKALSSAISNLKTLKLNSLCCTLADIAINNTNITWKTRQIVEVFNDALYQYQHTKSIKEQNINITKIQISASKETEVKANFGLQQGLAIAKGVDLAKFLADLPANICTPSYLAEQAVTIANNSDKMTVEILEESDMKTLGMGSFLSVSRGSRQAAKLIVLNYRGGKKDEKPIVLVGKGLTFDAGGISLKPSAGMDEMKYDMCGGASVLGTLQASAEMQLKINIVGIVPSSENMPDGDASKPGDILTSMSGLTIEVLNTDAEGRLILCDALTFAKKFDPEVVIDLATLTGACLVALGRIPSGLLGNDDDLCNDLIAASKTASDSLWRLPLWDEYRDLLKSNFADLANIGGRDAGTITAACFLSRFTENYRWAHLDIAGTAWHSGGANKGATGRPVPLLSQYLIDRAND
ncbi:MAG: leucyl aminopeptidase [Methylococcales symbiont of Iophon sp. n. MRB-2018]|nr:MAG: leucyl aminopeptidase [Methylococcales symbiont of Iophon sp. n. MRB-2018]KAF3980566.1 MAG: leucyl aminopeptidase [Methylococcales symbiont of Iophon sp. n. MRB-2018]